MPGGRVFQRSITLAIGAGVALCLAACGGGSHGRVNLVDISPESDADAVGEYDQPAAPKQILPIAEVLREIDSFPVPEGIDPALFTELVAALRREISGFSATKVISGITVVEDLEIIDHGENSYTAQWSFRNVGDYNQDGLVNVSDLTPIGQHWEARRGDDNWEIARLADGNNDGMVTVSDITPIGVNYYSSVASYVLESAAADQQEFTTALEAPLSQAQGIPKRFVVELAEPTEDWYRLVARDSSDALLEPCAAVARPGGAGGHFIRGAVIEEAVADAGTPIRLEAGELTLDIAADAVAEDARVLMRRANLSSDVQDEALSPPMVIEFPDLPEGEEVIVNWRCDGIPADAEEGDHDLVVIRRGEWVEEYSGVEGLQEYMLYSWGEMDEGASSGKAALMDGDTVFIWAGPPDDADKAASSYGYGVPMLGAEYIADPSMRPYDSAPVHVIFIHGLDPWDQGSFLGYFNQWHITDHWHNFAGPDDQSRSILSDIAGDPRSVKLWWYYYKSINTPIFDAGGDGSHLSTEIQQKILSKNPSAKVIFCGYSMGALVAKSAYADLRYYGGNSNILAGFISLNGVNNGTEWVNINSELGGLVFQYFANRPGIRHLASPYKFEVDLSKIHWYWSGTREITRLANEPLAYVNTQYASIWNSSSRCTYLGSFMDSGFDWYLSGLRTQTYLDSITRYTWRVGVPSTYLNLPAANSNLRKYNGKSNHDGIVPFYSQKGREIDGSWPLGFYPPLLGQSWPANHGQPHGSAGNNPSAGLKAQVKAAITKYVNNVLGSQTPPGPPRNVAVSYDDANYQGGINVYWEPPGSGAQPDSYQVRRATVPGSGFSESRTITVSHVHFVDDSPISGPLLQVEYNYEVRSGRGGQYSEWVQASDKGRAVGSIPGVSTWAVSWNDSNYPNGINLYWYLGQLAGASSWPKQVRIYRADSSSGPFSVLRTQTYQYGQGGYVDDNPPLAGGTHKWYKIECVNGNVGRYHTGTREGMVWTGSPEVKPEIQSVTPLSGLTGAVVTFSAETTGGTPSAWDWYFGSLGTPGFSEDATPTVTLSSSPGAYDCLLVASNSGGSDAFWFTVALESALEPPGAPVGFAASDGTYADYILFTWSAGPGPTPLGYRVYMGDGPSGPFDQQVAHVFWPSTTAQWYAPDHDLHYFAVLAYNGAGTSGFSSSNSGFRQLSPPTNVTASDGDYTDKIRITWTKSTGATGYRIYRDSQSNLIATLGDVAVYDDFAVDDYDPHTYWLEGFNAIGDSPYSESDTGFQKPTSGWIIETVGDGGSGQTSLALDSADRPHIGYLGRGNTHLKYAYFNGSTWSTITVDTYGFDGTCGRYCCIALDSSGNPHISYRHGDPGYDLKYAYFNGASWVTETVESDGYTGSNTGIAIDSSDHPHIAYRGETGPSDYLKYAYHDGTQWLIESVAQLGIPGSGHRASLRLDSSGNPCIATYDYGGEDLVYLANDGSSWSSDVVDSTGCVGRWPSLVLDSLWRPHISYADTSNYDLKYAHYDGESWQIELVDAEGTNGYLSWLALDSANNPHISYQADPVPSNDLELRYAYHDGMQWHVETVDNDDSAGYYSSIAIDSQDKPYISYIKEGGGSHLRYASRID